MGKREYEYYDNMKNGDRKMECDHGVDPVWYAAMIRKQRMREREEEYKEKMKATFEMKSLDDITEILNEHGMVLEDEDDDSEDADAE